MGDPECSVPWCHEEGIVKVEVPVWDDPHKWGAELKWILFCGGHGPLVGGDV